MRHTAGRVPIPSTAFSHDSGFRRKRARVEDRDHLKFIRTKLPCAVCGTRNAIQAAHLRAANPVYAKRATGIGEKPADKWTLPLCAAHHAEQHTGNEMDFWDRCGIDPFKLSLSLYGHSGDEEACELVIRLARQEARK